MVYKKRICKACKKERVIFSKGRCRSCASKTYRKAAKVSTKQKTINEKLTEIKKSLIVKYQSRCQGCGVQTTCLELSHIIRRSKRPDLVVEKDNCTLHCNWALNQCHRKWDSGNIELMMSLKDYKKNTAYIQKVDTSIYESLMEKARVYQISLPRKPE